MSDYFWLPQRARVPAPGEVEAYLLRQGWSHLETNSYWAYFQKDFQGRPLTVEVPQKGAAIDYPRAVALLLEDLMRLEGRAAAAIIEDL